jgi:hypothetical protein
VSSFWGSFFGALIYGFGPFTLWLNNFHPAAGLLIAVMPWLFCPAAFGPKGKWQWMSLVLSALPFLAVLAFFQLCGYLHFFVIPKQLKMHLFDLASLFAPYAQIAEKPLAVGFYHIPIACLIMGFAMLIAAQRIGIMVIGGLGFVLAFSNSFLNVSPIVWFAVPTLCCCIIIAAGTQALATAGLADRKWVLVSAMVLAGLAIVMMLIALKRSAAFSEAARMYVLGTVVVGTIFFMLQAKMRLTWVRMLILCLAMGVDVFFGARYIVDRLF